MFTTDIIGQHSSYLYTAVFLRANTMATIYFIRGYYLRAVTNQGWCLLNSA